MNSYFFKEIFAGSLRLWVESSRSDTSPFLKIRFPATFSPCFLLWKMRRGWRGGLLAPSGDKDARTQAPRPEARQGTQACHSKRRP